MAPLRFAFIGCGAIARLHLQALRENAHRTPTQLVAAVDVRRKSAEKLAELVEPNCRVSGRGLFKVHRAEIEHLGTKINSNENVCQ